MNNYGRYNNNNAGGGSGGGGGDGSFLADADTLDVLGQLSTEVGAGFSKPQLAAAMHLLRLGVNPSALVAITQELRRMTHNTPPVIQPPVHNVIHTSSTNITDNGYAYGPSSRHQTYGHQGFSSGPPIY
ncbi:hypothetical protein GGF37_000465 [Kickxella alabastrina]|nr:hypothetical protein GGF37_000465 [Kickxella alabastrina]